MMFLMWWVMMVAMMVPSAAPLVLLATAVTAARGRTGARPEAGLLTAGYLTVWGGFSLVATLAQWGLELAGLLSPETMAAGPAVAGGILLGGRPLPADPAQAGLPDALPLAGGLPRRALAPGPAGAFRMGLAHGRSASAAAGS
jgi:hypothetical protein